MAGNNANFLINITTRFQAAGLNEIAAQARRALAEVGSLPPAERQQAVSNVRVQAEQRLAQLRQQTLSPTGELSAKDKGLFSRAGADLNRAFKDIKDGVVDLSKIDLKSYPPRIRKIFEEATAEFNSLPAATRRSVSDAVRRAEGQSSAQAVRLGSQQAAAAAARGSGAGKAARVDPTASDRALDRREKAVETAQQAAIEAADKELIDATVLAAQSRRDLAARTQAQALGINIRDASGAFRSTEQLGAEASVRQRINADREYTRQVLLRADRESVLGQEIRQAEAERRQATRALAEVEHQEARLEVLNAIKDPNSKATFFQKLQARAQYRGPQRLPEDYQTLGQFVGARALTTIGFGVAGTALYGSVRVIGDMIKESAELDRQLNQIQAQLESIGKSAAGTFTQARSGILQIAKDTGAQADQVASVFFQFRGAFGGNEDSLTGTAEALRQTSSAMKIVAVTGLSLTEVLDSLTAIAKTFGTDVDTISDKALGLQERFGVLAKETITFTADLAPVAEQIGLSLEDTAALGAVAQQVSGRAGSSLAEGFSRIFPAISDAKTAIISLYNLPQLQSGRGLILQGFASGQTGQVFEQLVRDYNKLGKAQQDYVVNLLGGRREAQVLIPVLQNSSKLVKEWDNNLQGLNNDQGKTDDYFGRLRDTLQNTQARFTEAGKQIGEALLSAGILDAVLDITNAFGGLLGVVSGVLGFFGRLNEMTGGIAGRFLLVAAAVRLVSPLLEASGVVAGKVATTVRSTVTANEQQAIAQQQVAVASREAAVATEAAAKADLSETTSSNTAAAANERQAFSRGLFAGGAGGNRIAQAQSAAAVENAAFLDAARRRTFGEFAGGVGSSAKSALFGGGSFIGKGVPEATGLLGTLTKAAPVYLAFEALSQFMSNTARQAQEAQKTADDARSKLDAASRGIGGKSQDQVIADLGQQANDLRRNNQKFIDPKYGPLATGVNFVAGLFSHNDAAKRAAAGKPQDYAQVEKQIAITKSAKGSDSITTLLEKDSDSFIERLRSTNLDVLTNDIKDNPDYQSKAVKKFTDRNLKVDKSDITPEKLRDLIKAAQGGDQLAGLLVERIGTYIATQEDFSKFIQSDLDQKSKQKAIEDAGGAGNLALSTVQQAKSRYDAGSIGFDAYLKKLQEERQALIDYLNAQAASGALPSAEDLAAIAQMNKDVRTKVGERQIEAQTRLAQYQDLIGVGSASQQKAVGGTRLVNGIAVAGDVQGAVLNSRIDQLREFVSAGSGADFEQKIAKVPELIQLLQQRFQNQLEKIKDPLERQKAAERGFDIPIELQELLASQELQENPAVEKSLTELDAITHQGLGNYMQKLGKGVVDTGETARQVILDIIDQEIANLEKYIQGAFPEPPPFVTPDGKVIEGGLLGPIAGEQFKSPEQKAAEKNLENLRKQREKVAGDTSLENVLPPSSTPKGYAAPGDEAKIAQDIIDKENAQRELDKARANGDPLKIAALNRDGARAARDRAANSDDVTRLKAEAEYQDAQNEYDRAQEDIVNARLDFEKSKVARDPVRSARIAVEQARNAVNQARGTAERLRAQGQLVSAQNDLAKAMQDITQAQLEQVEAIAESSGNMVGAAVARVKIAQEKLQEVLADPASGEAEQVRAKTALIQAQAGARDAQYQDQFDTIDFMLQMEKISVAQAVQMLETLARIPGLTEQQIRNIQLRIRSLQQQASQDLQFNIPSDIKLPTLYEVRRLNQSQGGYSNNDNRTQNFILNINNQMDLEAAKKVIAEAAGQSNVVYGSGNRKY